jgi:hypothetical protein
LTTNSTHISTTIANSDNVGCHAVRNGNSGGCGGGGGGGGGGDHGCISLDTNCSELGRMNLCASALWGLFHVVLIARRGVVHFDILHFVVDNVFVVG